MFSTTAKLQHRTPLPAGVPASRGVKLLQDHEFFIKCDPHMVKYEAVTAPPDPAPTIPEDREIVATAPPKCYTVTDRVQALAKGFWETDAVSTYEFFDMDTGVFIRIRSPLSTIMETAWEVKETESGDLELVEDIVIKCSRLLVRVVKNACEAEWAGIHARMMARLSEDEP